MEALLSIAVVILVYVAYVIFRAGIITTLFESYKTRKGKEESVEGAEKRR